MVLLSVCVHLQFTFLMGIVRVLEISLLMTSEWCLRVRSRARRFSSYELHGDVFVRILSWLGEKRRLFLELLRSHLLDNF